MCYGRDGCGLPAKKKKAMEKSSTRRRISEEAKERQEDVKRKT